MTSIRIDREVFFSKISKIVKFTPKAAVIPAFTNLKLTVENGIMEIIAADASIQCKMHCPVSKSEPFSICLPAGLLVATIGSFRENEIKLSVKDNKVELVSGKGKGRSVYNITMDCLAQDFPVMIMDQVTSEIAIQQFFLKLAFKSAKQFIDEKAGANTATVGINIAEIGNKMIFTGLDQRAICRASIKPISINHWSSIVVPTDTANKITSLLDEKGEINIVHCGDKVRFFTNHESSDYFEVTSVTVNGKYPDAEQFFSNKPTDRYILNTIELLDAVKRLKLYANDDDVPKVRFEVISDTEIQLVSENVNYGRGGQEIITYEGHSDNKLTKSYNIDNIIKILSIVESNEVRFIFEENKNRPSFIVPVVVTDEEDIYSFLTTNILA